MIKKLFLFASALCLTEALHAENITFADSNVKALCVQNWDGDGDGELSMEEAAAVTTLGAVFSENANIGTFEELKYFTGLTAIDDYAFYKSGIKTVSFSPTVTSIGEYAFSESNISGELHIPGTVKDIGDYAFYSCTCLTGVVLEEGVETVGWHSFSGPIRTLSLPSTLTYMSSMAIDPYVNANPSAGIFIPEGDLYVCVHSTTPAAINSFAFFYVYDAGHLVVPAGSVDAYKSADGWNRFGEYLEFGDVNGDGVVNVADAVCIVNWIVGKPNAKFFEEFVDVNNDGQKNIADAVTIINMVVGNGGGGSSDPEAKRMTWDAIDPE